jgi:hypothetical protein
MEVPQTGGKAMSKVYVSVALTRLRDLSRIACPSCGKRLNLHQPDVHLPDRMLGTCSKCQQWYVIHHQRGFMALIPGPDDLSSA